jgi:phosphoribosylanthranilate isomerase
VGAEAKICGLTRPGDAAMAAACGASYLGVVFAGGPRAVSAALAREIVLAAAPVPVLGVFGPVEVGDILRVVRAAGLAGAQLHGADPPPALLAGVGIVWRVRRLATAAEADALVDVPAADAVLVEPAVPGRAGGAGVALDLDLAGRARERLGGRRMVLAGGLGPGSVGEAVRRVRCEVVDVSSGVETPGRPGIKDAGRMRDFLEAVRGP